MSIARPSFDIIVSAENNAYMAWQSMLFHYSCVEHMGFAPLIMVHGGLEPLGEGFARIAATGGRIQRTDNYRYALPREYPGRNKSYSLARADTDAQFVMLCDPDMMFVKPLPFERITADFGRDDLSFDHADYLIPERHRPVLEPVCMAAGVDVARVLDIPVYGGVPHIVHHRRRQRLAREWREMNELYLEEALRFHRRMKSEVWISEMWGLVLACHRIGMTPRFIEFVVNNGGNPKLDRSSPEGPAMIHYCYRHESFDKMLYRSRADAGTVWRAALAPADTVNGEITAQLRAAAAYYDLDRP